ncbi:MAG: BspA family leucine-rich repeat surface protein [Clostridium sp.]|nr:BspA family leucine-rich repeat surface protein [Clostridium sp.]
MRKSNIIIKKVRNLMILSMAVIVIISVYFNILNSRAKETTDIVANVTDETGEVDSQKVTLVATGNKNGNYEISLPETISNVYVSNYKTLNGDKSANDKIVLSQDEVENKEINLEVNYDKKNVTSTKTNEEMTLYKQNLEYDDKGIYVEGYMPLLAQINVIQNENDISLEILYTVVESNNMSTKEIYVPSEYEQTLKITLNKKKYGVEQSLISSTDAEYIVVEQSNSKLVINNISSNTINITNEEVPTIISSQYNGEDNKYYFAGGPIANSQIESIKFVTNPKEVLGTKWDASENGDNSVIAGYIDSNGNELYEIYVASNSDKTTKVYTPEDASYMFYECSNLTTIDIQNLGTSKTTNMNSMFAMCTNVTTLELQNLDTSNVEDMENMFFGCENLETLDIINFITAKVTTMSNMFQNCKKLTELNLESFDTSKVIDMNSMFNGCESLTILNLNNFNTTEVTDMSWMFYNCKNITTLDISNFDTSNVIDMSAMFSTCENLTTLNISNFNTTEVTSMNAMFSDCKKLQILNISNFNISKVEDMSFMFSGCIKLSELDLGKQFTKIANENEGIFDGLEENQLVIKVPSAIYAGKNEIKLNNGSTDIITFLDNVKVECKYKIEWKKVSSSVDIAQKQINVVLQAEGVNTTYDSAKILTDGISKYLQLYIDGKIVDNLTVTIENQEVKNGKLQCTLKIKNEEIKDGEGMALVIKEDSATDKYGNGNLEIKLIITEPLPIMQNTQYNGDDNKYYFAGGTIENSKIESIKFVASKEEVLGTQWDASKNGNNSVIAGYVDSNNNGLYEIYVASNSEKTTKVYMPEDASYMFYEGNNLTTIDLQNINTSKTINMNSMFAICNNLTTLNLSSFDTSKVIDMENMFYKNEKLVTLDISSFNTSEVTTMSNMFSNCTSLTKLDLNNFNTSQVTNMSYMFNRCVNLTSLDVRKFDTSQVTDMSYMFSEGEALETLDVSKFDTSQVTNMGAMFYNCSRLTSLDVSEFDTSQVTDMGHMFSNCNGLTNLDVSKFDTSQVTNMKAMFQACRKLIELNISNFNTSQVTNMSYMFCNCSSLRSIYVSEYNETTGKGWTTKNVTDSDNMFTGATKLVGGNGTVYNSSYIDATYARIDKEAEPGYLTKSVKGTTFDKDEKIFISGEAVTIPAGMTVSSFKGEFESIDQGIVIYRLNGDVPDWTNKTKMQETYDQFVWVPVKNAILDLSSTYSGLDYAGLISKVQEQINVGKYPMAIKTNTAGDYIGVLYEFSEVTENNTTYVKVIPNSKWKPKSKKANLNYIEMDSKREPGGLTSSTYGDTETNLKQINGILNTSYNSTTSFKSALQSQYNEMVKKVEEKGGFWVGRYETSSMSNSTTENYIASNRIQVSSKRNTTNGIGDVTWYKMYAQQKIYSELALESKTTSSMIWGSQYDQIMIWMKGEKSSDQASSRGKYYVTNGAGKGNYGTISGVENDVYSGIAPTGSQDIYSIKNIFDLAGNVFEWSLEASMTAFRVERGGSYYDTDAYYTRPDDRYSQRPSYP